jgi:hypothetical protein
VFHRNDGNGNERVVFRRIDDLAVEVIRRAKEARAAAANRAGPDAMKRDATEAASSQGGKENIRQPSPADGRPVLTVRHNVKCLPARPKSVPPLCAGRHLKSIWSARNGNHDGEGVWAHAVALSLSAIANWQEGQ